jgi:hypothetical protein
MLCIAAIFSATHTDKKILSQKGNKRKTNGYNVFDAFADLINFKTELIMKKLLLMILTAALYTSCIKQTDAPAAKAEDMTMDNAIAADTPIVKISNLKREDTVAGTVTIKVKVTDNVSIDSVQCTVDGVSLGKKTITPYNFVWNTKTVLNGTHLLIATAFDHSGRSKSKKITISTNNTAILSIEQELIDLVNAERKNHGLTPYTFIHSFSRQPVAIH